VLYHMYRSIIHCHSVYVATQEKKEK
jgi:hypothetical protein